MSQYLAETSYSPPGSGNTHHFSDSAPGHCPEQPVANPDDLADLLKQCLIAVESGLRGPIPPGSHSDVGSVGGDPCVLPVQCQSCGDPNLDTSRISLPDHTSPPHRQSHNNNYPEPHLVKARVFPGYHRGHHQSRGHRSRGHDALSSDDSRHHPDPHGDRGVEARAVHRRTHDGHLVVQERPPCTHSIQLPVTIDRLHQGVLRSGAVLYSACKDYHGAETVLVFCRHPAWQAAHFSSVELAKLLLYYYTVTREEDRVQGLTVIVDARGTTLEVLNTLLETLYTVEANQSGTVNITHVLADRVAQSLLFKSSVFRPQVKLRIDLVNSIETLFKFVPRHGLPPQLGGTLHLRHDSWCLYRLKLEPFLQSCRHGAQILMSAMDKMSQDPPVPGSPTDPDTTRVLIQKQRDTIRETLHSPVLMGLQNDGEHTLGQLRDQAHVLGSNGDYRSSVETAGRLYGQLDVTVKRLVVLAEERVRRLELSQRLASVQSRAQQILSWIHSEGTEILNPFEKISDNLKGIRDQQKQFDKVYYKAVTQLEKANDLLEEAKHLTKSESDDSGDGPGVTEVTGVKDISKDLQGHMTQYSTKLEDMRERINNTSECYHLLDKSYEWALGAMKYAASIKTDKSSTVESIEGHLESLEVYVQDHPPLSADTFELMLDLAKRLENDKLYEQCTIARTRCVETEQLLQERSAKLKHVRERHLREEQQQQQQDSEVVSDKVQDTSRVTTDAQTTMSTTDSVDQSEGPVHLSHSHNSLNTAGRVPPTTGEDTITSSRPRAVRGSVSGAQGTTGGRQVQGSSVGHGGAFADRDLYMSHIMNLLRRRSYAGKPSAPLYSPGVAAFKDSVRDMNLWEYEEYLFNEGLITEDMSDRIVAFLPKGLSDSTLHGSRESLKGSVENLAKLAVTERKADSSTALAHQISASILQDMKAAGNVPPPPSPAPLRRSAHKGTSRPHRKMLKKANSCSLPETGCASPDVILPSIREIRDNRSISMITGSSESLACMPEEDDLLPSHHPLSHRSEDTTDSTRSPSTASVTSDTPAGTAGITTERKFGWSPVPVNTHLLQRQAAKPQFSTSHSMADLRLSEEEEKQRRHLSHILHEMIQTERDYVRSLQFIIDNYIPEMSRDDVPQALRGKRNIVFGNLEKIYEFHSTQFLGELERCQANPYQIGCCFLDHVQEFFLYALYNKNKPKSDILMTDYGMAFFKRKQLELGDRMDLNSYLLKPVQRMGKYSLLLRQIIKECAETEPEYNDLMAAVEMVKFQLRHGNDLLAMDCLKACDVNLQEQGMLLRQDEFLVWQGRKKCLRHVFLFEEMVLFSKTKRTSSGSDSYIYKNSIKTSELGLTESFTDSRYKFEIWFRKRTPGDTFVIQAPTMDVKNAWVKEISMLLWKQAFRNRERRLSEAARMGVGRKPCVDLKPSKDNIQDRFVNVGTMGRQGVTVPRMRNSIAVSSFDHLRNGSKRPHSLISVSSSSSGNSSQSANSCPNQQQAGVGAAITPVHLVHSSSAVTIGNPEMSSVGQSHTYGGGDLILSPKMYTGFSNESGIEVDLNASMMSNMSVMEDASTQTTLKRQPRRKDSSHLSEGGVGMETSDQGLVMGRMTSTEHALCTDV